MSRWPGAIEEPVLPHNNHSFHPQATSTLQRLRPGGHTGLVKQREEKKEEWDWEVFHWIKERFEPHAGGLVMKIISLTMS